MVCTKQNQHCICQSAKYLHFPKMSRGLGTGREGGGGSKYHFNGVWLYLVIIEKTVYSYRGYVCKKWDKKSRYVEDLER